MAVFAGSRIRDNNVFGTTTDNPLTNVATTMNSAGLANLSAVSSNHAVLILDPLRSAGAPEIVIVTAHTGAATSATITRGALGSSARQHASGTLWVLAPTIDDVIRIVTSSTRPSDQYEGELVYETDTDYYMGHNGTAWEHGLKLGAWVSWTPALTNITVGSGTLTCAYVKIGRTVAYRFKFVYGAGSAVGTGPTFTLPVAPNAAYTAFHPMHDAVHFLDAGTTVFAGTTEFSSGSIVTILAAGAAGATVDRGSVSSTVPMTWASGDTMFITGTYEAAA